jgi:hypothetical protein
MVRVFGETYERGTSGTQMLMAHVGPVKVTRVSVRVSLSLPIPIDIEQQFGRRFHITVELLELRDCPMVGSRTDQPSQFLQVIHPISLHERSRE